MERTTSSDDAIPSYDEPLIDAGARKAPEQKFQTGPLKGRCKSKWIEDLVPSNPYIGIDGKLHMERRYDTRNFESEESFSNISNAIRQRVKDILQGKRQQESNGHEYYFSIDALPFFRKHCRELLNHGWVPVIRKDEYDRYGTPIYPDDRLFEAEEMNARELPDGAFIALIRCPNNLEISDFIKPMPVEEVMEKAAAGQLGFSNQYSRTNQIAVAILDEKKGWDGPVMLPNVKYACEPLEQVKQYGTGMFEGIGVERTEDGQIVIFRLEDHIQRMYRGAKFYDMIPKPPKLEGKEKTEQELKRWEHQQFEQFRKLFTQMAIDMVRANEKYIPPYGQGRLYLRPDFFDHGPKMHADNSGRYMLMMTAIPIGSAESYFSPGEKTFLMARRRARVAEGSMEGLVKSIAHYGKVVRLLRTANAHGMAGVIFTNSAGDRIEETNASSIIFIITTKDGKRKIITPSLKHLTILDSVTRKTCLTLAQNELGWETEERDISPDELLLYSLRDENLFGIIKKIMDNADKINDGDFYAPSLKQLEFAKNIQDIEALAAGTGAALTPIHKIQIGRVNPETDEIEEEEALIEIDRTATEPSKKGMGPAGKELFDLLLAVKSGKLQKNMREKMQGANASEQDKIAEKLAQYEKWLTFVPMEHV